MLQVFRLSVMSCMEDSFLADWMYNQSCFAAMLIELFDFVLMICMMKCMLKVSFFVHDKGFL